jgi:hypothetical protein
MNTIGSTTVGQNPFQFLQQPTTGQQGSSTASTASTAAASVASATASGSSATDPTQQLLSATGKHKHHHHGGGGNKNDSDGIQDLLNAVTTALNSSDASSDPNQVIQDTITKLLSGDGTGTDSTTTTSTAATTTGAAAAPTSAQSFAAMLKAHGVDLTQFKADLTAAVKNAQNGQVNPAAALKSIPPGSAISLTA